MTWLPDGSAIVFPAPADKMSVNPQIWQVSYPDAEARRITNDLNFYNGATITADGSALATVQVSLMANLSITNFGSSISFSSPQQVTSGVGRADGLGGITWAPGDKIIYGYYSAGTIRLASVAPDGSKLHDLALNAVEPLGPTPAATASILFSLRATRRKESPCGALILTAAIRRKSLLALSTSFRLVYDGKFLVYSDASGAGRVMRIGIDGGHPRCDQGIYAISSNFPGQSNHGGILLARPLQGDEIAIVGLEGGEIRSLYDVPNETITGAGDGGHKLEWTKDGKNVIYAVYKDEIASIWAQPGGLPVFRRAAETSCEFPS